MVEILNHKNISDTIEKNGEITPNDLNNAELTAPQKEIAKELITATAKQKGETFEGAVNKSVWSSQDTYDDKFNHALNTAILILNTDAKKIAVISFILPFTSLQSSFISYLLGKILKKIG